MARLIGILGLALVWPELALAHAGDQGFVLLLPTDVYAGAGVAVVALTVVALFALPDRVSLAMFAARAGKARRDWQGARDVTSVLSFLMLAGIVALGMAGPRDPLSNLMPLTFWTLGWVGVVTLSGLIPGLWHWVNPWTGLYHWLAPGWRIRPLPARWGLWPAVLMLIGFAAFLLADIAPDDPERLAVFVACYWAAIMGAVLISGESVLNQVELGHAIMGAFGKLTWGKSEARGWPGWQITRADPMAASGAFALTLLAVGSFDGINETFWWLAQIGVNPLEFPGRSAVVTQTLIGLALSIAGLLAVFLLTLWLGVKIASAQVDFPRLVGHMALSLLPIAFVYHIAHYLTSFLVMIQYTVAALNDPLNTGADLFGIEPFRVTTGFFNRLDWVRVIWLTQAGLVVLGHVWSVLLAHRIALDHFERGRRAALATLPLSLFMIAYTLLGLWLLAAPRGA
ncbi:MAG: hypothetical protein OIF48_07570 [Silicimonas sp.]|nr:hypothetical protein [Silicimonas sp.]